MAGPAAILLLCASSALGQVQAPDKAYIEQIPRNVLRPAISLPPPAQRGAASNPAAGPAQAAPRPAPPPTARPAVTAGGPAAGLPPMGPPPQTLRPALVAVARATPGVAASAARPAAASQTATGVCLIRAGTFSERANAENLAKALKPLGAVRVNAMVLGGKAVHIVTLVELGTRKDAELALARLNASGQDLGPLSISGCQI